MVWGTISSLGAFAEGVRKVLNYPLFHLYEFMVLASRKTKLVLSVLRRWVNFRWVNLRPFFCVIPSLVKEQRYYHTCLEQVPHYPYTYLPWHYGLFSLTPLPTAVALLRRRDPCSCAAAPACRLPPPPILQRRPKMNFQGRTHGAGALILA